MKLKKNEMPRHDMKSCIHSLVSIVHKNGIIKIFLILFEFLIDLGMFT
jgi:hypothetical protein